jgi:hypothetical protein
MTRRRQSLEKEQAMANKNSLKIVDKDSGEVSPAGYAAVVENIILSSTGLEAFDSGPDDFTAERTKKLIQNAEKNAQGAPTNAVIKQLNHNNELETINENNCRIKAKRDRRRPATGHSNVTVPLPEQALNIGELDYIDIYLRKFLEIYNPDFQFPNPKTDRSAQQARKYMFGVFMFTKCR